VFVHGGFPVSFPDVSEAVWGLTEHITFVVVTRQAADFEAVENLGDNSGYGQGPYGFGPYGGGLVDPSGIFDGSLQPLKPQSLMLKPEGQRSWRWWTLWTESFMNVGDKIVDYYGKRYKIMSTANWSGGGYYEYELVEGFEEPAS
jgi:hypothetical protein